MGRRPGCSQWAGRGGRVQPGASDGQMGPARVQKGLAQGAAEAGEDGGQDGGRGRWKDGTGRQDRGGLLGVAVHRGCWRGQLSDRSSPWGEVRRLPSPFLAWPPVSPTPCRESGPILQSWV